MTGYLPPINDIRFLIHKVIGLDAIAALPPYRETSAELADAILDEAGKFSSQILAPLNRIGDLQGAKLATDGTVKTPDGWHTAYQHFVEGGWQGICASPNDGGMGLPLLLGAAVSEMWHSANMAFALCPMLTSGAIELLARHASADQKERFLRRMISGEWTGTMNLTEPQAGSDLSHIRTRAEPQADGTYAIRGQKIFITYGDHDLTDNIVHLVLARTPDAPAGTRGISLFIVPKFRLNADGNPGEHNDVRCVSLEHKLGIHGSPTAVLSFGDTDGATGYLVGTEGSGLACMFTMMNNARLAVGQQGIAISERAFQLALDFAKTRKQGRDPRNRTECTILHHPDIHRMLMRMRSSTDAARALALYAASRLDLAHHHPDGDMQNAAQAEADLLIPMVKSWSTDLGVENASLGIQIHGGMGFIEETGAAQHLRDSRIAPIYEGTNGIQALDLIGRKVLRDGGKAARHLILKITDDCTAFGVAYPDEAACVQKAMEQLDGATTHILHTCPQDPVLMQAVASPYLRLFATCLGGWIMIRSLDALTTGEEPSNFRDQKTASTKFFLRQILPETETAAQQIYNSTSDDFASPERVFG
ncbi:acyl-CoA dehydrogenase [Thalassospira sp.]|uniref:acyl-CoA dehydrogenase n=1 Tax=Thalassospira sp. TaxID=1912094 RepID=UPI0027362617|nr:acyl-CoA dehydrogenase [Thalassospira sp.]MDP2700060.1 acyl-CoA dehydrogenase [Thalassospira sp.]